MKLYEVSVCTFPAYKETNISARAQERDADHERRIRAVKDDLIRRVRATGETNPSVS